jgi:glycyl-tRNA synthetase
MVLADSYQQDKEGRVYLDLKPKLAPYQAAVFPLLKNKPNLTNKATEIYRQLLKKVHTTYDDRGNIGKRYLYQDEIGTPFCITIDFETLENDTLTVRERNTTQQKRIAVSELVPYLQKMVNS